MPLDRMKLRTFPFSKSIGNMKPSMTTFFPWSALISFGNGSRAALSLVCGQYRNASFEKVSSIGFSSTGGGLTSGAGLTSAATGLGSGGAGFGSGFGSGLGSGLTSATTGGGSILTTTGSGLGAGGSTGFTGRSNDVPWTWASGTGAACGVSVLNQMNAPAATATKKTAARALVIDST